MRLLHPLSDLVLASRTQSRDDFLQRYPVPALVLRERVVGDLQFAEPGRWEAEPRAGSTLLHVPRLELAERLNRPPQPGREAVAEMRYALLDGGGQLSVVLGRDREAEVRLNDFTVSARHARFHLAPGTWRVAVEDLRSRNGTAVNGTRLAATEQVELVSGDEVIAGRFVFWFLDPADLWELVQ